MIRQDYASDKTPAWNKPENWITGLVSLAIIDIALIVAMSVYIQYLR